MGSNTSYELPRDTRGLTGFSNEKQGRHSLSKFQGIYLKATDFQDESYTKIIEGGDFRKIVMVDVGDYASDEQRQEILKAFVTHLALPWKRNEILLSPIRYIKRYERKLELLDYRCLRKDAMLLHEIISGNKIRILILHNCDLKAKALKEILSGATSVTSLDLSESKLGREEATVLSRYIGRKPPSQLILRGCNVPTEVMPKVIPSPGENNRAIHLDISGNCLDETTIDRIAILIERRKLDKLVMENCKPSTEIYRKIVKEWKPHILQRQDRANVKGRRAVVFKVKSTAIQICKEGYSGLYRETEILNKSAGTSCSSSVRSQSKETLLARLSQKLATDRYFFSVYKNTNDKNAIIISIGEKEKIRENASACQESMELMPISLEQNQEHELLVNCESNPDIGCPKLEPFNEGEITKHGFIKRRLVLLNTQNLEDEELVVIVSVHHQEKTLLSEVFLVQLKSDDKKKNDEASGSVLRLNINNYNSGGNGTVTEAAAVKGNVDTVNIDGEAETNVTCQK